MDAHHVESIKLSEAIQALVSQALSSSGTTAALDSQLVELHVSRWPKLYQQSLSRLISLSGVVASYRPFS